MNRLEMVELEYVVAVAEELSFTGAAARLGMAQPALSRAVARTERRLGVSLFTRTTRSVSLSAAGETFVTGARSLLAELDGLIVSTRSGERDRPLTIALRPAAGTGLLTDALRTWRGHAVRVEPTRDPVGAVRTGLADLAIACITDDVDGLHARQIGEEPTVVLVPRGHPLTRELRVTVAKVTATDGFQVRCPDLSLDEIADRVAFAGLIVIAAADVTPRIGPHVRALPVSDAPATTFCVVRRSSRGHHAAPAFVRHLSSPDLNVTSAGLATPTTGTPPAAVAPSSLTA